MRPVKDLERGQGPSRTTRTCLAAPVTLEVPFPHKGPRSRRLRAESHWPRSHSLPVTPGCLLHSAFLCVSTLEHLLMMGLSHCAYRKTSMVQNYTEQDVRLLLSRSPGPVALPEVPAVPNSLRI